MTVAVLNPSRISIWLMMTLNSFLSQLVMSREMRESTPYSTMGWSTSMSSGDIISRLPSFSAIFFCRSSIESSESTGERERGEMLVWNWVKGKRLHYRFSSLV